MYSSVRAKAIVIEDDTGIKSELPIILIESGEFSPITDYLLYKQQEGKSKTWMDRVIRATRLLMDYMEANKDCFTTPHLLFQTFVKRLYSGTIGNDGLDPSGLYWLPTTVTTTNTLISSLTGLMDWLVINNKTKHMNPLVEADSFTQRLNYAAWYRKNQNDFLGHLADRHMNKTTSESATASHLRFSESLRRWQF